MLNTQFRQSGFTLVELMIGVFILALLASVGAPAMQSWVQNAQIRTTANVIQNGLQLARAEAVHRNSPVRFQFTSTIDNACVLSTTSSNWVVSQDDPTNPASLCGSAPSDILVPRIIQKRSSAEGSSNTVVAASLSTIVFNGLGRASTGTVTIDLRNTKGGACAPAGAMRCLRIEVTTAGQVRMCDPAKASTDPQGC
jgi:type IV fimbrial biogenesis protein FimT